jgi:hypothetical protein
MMEYMKAIMRWYQDEDLPTFQQREPNGHVWLKEFLKHHKSHIRAECAEMICWKLCIEYHDKGYYQDIWVWFPDVEGGTVCMPTCPTCKSKAHVRKHSYPLDHPGSTFDTYYYIMSWQYLCIDCKKTNDDQKKAAGGQPFEKIQYTTMGYCWES